MPSTKIKPRCRAAAPCTGVNAVSRPGECNPQQGSLEGKSVVILAYNKTNHEVFVRQGAQFYSLKVQFYKNSSPTTAPAKRNKVTHYNRSCAKKFDEIQLYAAPEVLDGGDVDGSKVYADFLKSSGDNDEIVSSYKRTADKSNGVALNVLQGAGQWYKKSCASHGAVVQSAYTVGDVTPVVANVDQVVGLTNGSPAGHLSLQAGFRLTSMLSLLTGVLGFFNACGKYSDAVKAGDVEDVKLAFISMGRGVVEIISGSLAVTYRALLLAGHLVSGFVLQKLSLVSTFFGCLYIMLLAAPFTNAVCRGSKAIAKIEKNHGNLSSVFELDDKDIKLGVYKRLNINPIHDKMSDDEICDAYEALRSYSLDSDTQIVDKEVKLLDSDKQIDDEEVELLVLEDSLWLKNTLVGSNLKDLLTKHYKHEVMVQKNIIERHLKEDFALNDSQIQQIKTNESSNRILAHMKRQRKINFAIASLCFTMAVASIASVFITGGVPLVAYIVMSLFLNLAMLYVDGFYLWENVKNSSKASSFDTKACLIVGLATIAATVVGIVFTKDLGLKIMQGAIGALMLAGQAKVVYDIRNATGNGVSRPSPDLGELGA
jgi:hypothetical protein